MKVNILFSFENFKKILDLYIIIYKILFNITIEDYKPFNYFIYNKLYSKIRNS